MSKWSGIRSCEETAPSTVGYFGLMKYTQDFQDQQIQLLKEQPKEAEARCLASSVG
jgi:hypothetical protein